MFSQVAFNPFSRRSRDDCFDEIHSALIRSSSTCKILKQNTCKYQYKKHIGQNLELLEFRAGQDTYSTSNSMSPPETGVPYQTNR